MSPPRKIPDPTALIPLAKAGLKRRAIARRLGCGVTVVYEALASLKKAGHDLPAHPPARALDRKKERELIRLVQQGESRDNCARHFRCTPDTVGRTLARLRRERGLQCRFTQSRRNPHLRCAILAAITNGATTARAALRTTGRCGEGSGGAVVRELIRGGAIVAVGRGRGRTLAVAPEKKGVAR